jgi:hypothetical protein
LAEVCAAALELTVIALDNVAYRQNGRSLFIISQNRDIK